MRSAGAALFLFLSACGDPEQKFELTVTGEDGKPMSGVECKAWFKRPGNGGSAEDYLVSGTTDLAGAISLQGQTSWALTSVEANSHGCYPAGAGEHWARKQNGNRWEPWPVEVNLVMKKIREPKPMFAVRPYDNLRFRFPSPDMPGSLAFDLEAMDWVAPAGKGRVADFLIEGVRFDLNDMSRKPNGWIKITFPNPGDGILRVSDKGGSALIGPSVAPLDGYQSKWEFPNWIQDDGSGPTDSSCFVFRCRSIMSKKGDIVEARYGKIAGNVQGSLFHERPFFRMTYYFNGKANERGLEWDQKTNLLTNVDQAHWPLSP